MLEVLPEPREDYKPFVPRIVQIQIPRDFIGAVIGQGGKVIQEMQRETNTVTSSKRKSRRAGCRTSAGPPSAK